MKLVKAYAIQMTSNISDDEYINAQKASQLFENLLSEIKISMEHLDYLYTPFSKGSDFDPDTIVENRVILRNYRDKIKENFEKVISLSYKSLRLMDIFSTDSDVEELMNSFVSGINELEKQVNYLLSIFSNINSPDFISSVLAAITSVKKQCSQIRQLINDRVLEHIDTNILAKNWKSLVNDRFQDKVETKTPLIVELYKERQDALK